MTTPHRILDVGVDLDGVCYDFVDALRSWVATTTGRCPSTLPEPTCWDFPMADWGMTVEEFLAHFHAGVAAEHIFAVGDPYPGVAAGLRALVGAGHRVHIVTDRSVGLFGVGERLTRSWLARHDLAHTTLTISADKTSVRTDVFVEDRPKNYDQLVAAGVDVFLRDHPYNAHVTVPAGRRVAGFTEFAAAVLAARGAD